MPLDPNVPPHKTRAFWYWVALAVCITVAYPVLVRSQMSLAFQIFSGAFLFVAMVAIGWFAVRRVQRGQTTPSTLRIIVLIILGIIVMILDQIFKKYLW